MFFHWQVGVCLLRSGWILVMMPIKNDIYTMMVSYPISWVITSLAFLVYTLRFSRLGEMLRRKAA